MLAALFIAVTPLLIHLVGAIDGSQPFLIVSDATGLCLAAPSEDAVSGDALVFTNCSAWRQSTWGLADTGNDLAPIMHSELFFCVALGPRGFNPSGDLPLVLTSDCLGAAVPFADSAANTIHNALNSQLCLQASGGDPMEGAPAILAPNCVPIETLQFKIKYTTPPSPTCTGCFTLTASTAVNSPDSSWAKTCQTMAEAINTAEDLMTFAKLEGGQFQCTGEPEIVDGNVKLKICATGTDSITTYLNEIYSVMPLYSAVLLKDLAFECDLSLLIDSTCGQSQSYQSMCLQKKNLKKP